MTEEVRDQAIETATLGGGCFWCLEAVFLEVEGVEDVRSGYCGGETRDPSYREVCTGATGHAEVVRVDFDPSLITFREVLETFFDIHDPTTLNRQGADIGTQYRSVVFYRDEEQRRIAAEVIEELEESGVWEDPIVTELVPGKEFYPAEDYHQDYYNRNPSQPYCQFVIAPKVKKFRHRFRSRLQS